MDTDNPDFISVQSSAISLLNSLEPLVAYNSE